MQTQLSGEQLSLSSIFAVQPATTKPASEEDTRRKVKKTTNIKRAEALRRKAEALTTQIDKKRNPATAQQNVTRRRAGIIAGMAKDADRLELIQAKLNGLADAHEKGTIPTCLITIKSKSEVETLMDYSEYPTTQWYEKERERLERLNITNDAEFQEAKAALMKIGKTIERDTSKEEIASKERDLIGCKIPGYFPTPEAIVQQMIDLAGIEPNMTILEPSAGKGNIADIIRVQYPDNELSVIERSYTLREILELKGYTLSGDDFFQHTIKYDRILQNPPFEKGQDIDHVRHAYDKCLKVGGRLISIMSEGPFFRQDKKSTKFRDWLDSVYGSSIEIGNGFEHGERQTGVTSRIVIITKQEEEEDTKEENKRVETLGQKAQDI